MFNSRKAEKYVTQALEHVNAGRCQEALKNCEAAIKLKPNYSDAWSTNGRANQHCGDLQGAIRDYQEAYRLQPDAKLLKSIAGVYYVLANNDLYNCRNKEVVEHCDKAIELDPKNPFL